MNLQQQQQQQQQEQQQATTTVTPASGGRFDFDDGGTYCGGWHDGKAHGHGVCTGPKAQGEYSGSWHYGFEVSGVYTWPSGSTYEGHWQNGRRHGLGVESRCRWLYRGEWTQGLKGRYGVRQSCSSSAKYEGTWSNGLQDGYGSETYADSGTYQGQWQRGCRHGYGVRTSAAFGVASVSSTGKQPMSGSVSSLRSDPHADITADRDRRLRESRGGFVLRARSDDLPQRRGSLGERPANMRTNFIKNLRLRKQRSTGDLEKRDMTSSVRSTASSASWMSTESHVTNGTHHTDSNASFVVEDEQMDSGVTETYMGEWKNDRRTGYGVCERSDGLRYEGEWYNNRKYGYGVTTFRDGAREEGKYKNNVLVNTGKRRHVFLVRSAKLRERVEAASSAAQRASKIALQKADIAISRTATARGKAEQSDIAAMHSREDSDIARLHATQFAPDFHQPGADVLRPRLDSRLTNVSQLASNSKQASLQQNSSSPPDISTSLHRSTYDLARASTLDPPNGLPPGVEAPRLQPDYRTDPPPAMPAPPSQRPSETALLADVTDTVVAPASFSRPPANLRAESVDTAFSGRTRTSSRAGSVANSLRHGTAITDHYSQYSRPASRDGSVDRFSRLSRHTPLPHVASIERARAATDTAAVSRPPSEPRSQQSRATMSACSRRQLFSRSSNSSDKIPLPSSSSAVQRTPLSSLDDTTAGVKRTESMFMSGPQGCRGGTPTLTSTTLQRKKSLPDTAGLTVKAHVMPRQEANHLAAGQRELLRMRAAEAEMYRANPLLYLYNPRVKEWFSRQRLVLIVVTLNVLMALLFVRLMT